MNNNLQYDLDQLEVKRIGSGSSPILLLHGWGGNCDTLNSIGSPLAQHREVWSVSLPGFGNSPEPPMGWGTWDYVELIKAWIDRHQYESVDIIAHSFGGRVTIGLASRYPESIRKIILMSSAGLRVRHSRRVQLKIKLAWILKLLSNNIHGSVGKRINSYRSRLGSTDWKSSSPVMRAVMAKVLSQDEDLTNSLPKIKASTLLLWGEKDTATPVELAKRMVGLMPHAQLVIFRNAGHYVFLDRHGDTMSEIWKHFNLTQVW